MARRGLAIDRGRRSDRAALACCVALAALAAWLLAHLVWQFLPRGDAGAGAAVPSGAVPAAAPARPIASWHLFGQAPPRPGAAGAGTATTLSLILRGTVADADAKAGVAVVADMNGGERAYRVGQELAPGARLAGVYPDRIVVERGGVQETLRLARDRNLAPADVVRATPATASSRAPASRPAAAAAPTAPAQKAAQADAPKDWQQTVARLRQNPDELMRRVPVVPVLDGTRLTGVRLAEGGDGALIGRIGLRPGDVVTSVNGMPVDSLARGREIMTSLAGAQSARVTVLRDGKPTDLTIGLP
jgi:general secretion pathway protein C